MKHHVQRIVDHLYGPTGSVILHIVIVVILVKFVSFSSKTPPPEVEVMIMEAESIELEELKELEKELDDIEPPEVDVQVDVQQDVPTPDNVESFDNAQPDVDLSALDISDAASPLILKGLFSGRSAGARAGRLRAYGGSGATEAAVLKALDWLKANQQPDGSWVKNRVGMTGLALLTFLAHGETPNSKKYGQTVEKAIQYLLSHQNPNGLFGKPTPTQHGVYENAIATYAVAEAYGMTRVPALKTAMEGGLKWIIKGQQPGGGWDYAYKKGDRRDTSVSGWHVQALKAAYLSGAENPGIKECMKRAIADIKSVYNPSAKSFGYGGPGGKNPGMTGVGVLAMQFLGQAKSPEVKGGLEALDESKGEWD
ncbi:MAG: prenyltransferase/squalene oxidase repeat-containing protein, partial [Verrucomicrobiota bacterium]